ncbi:MAG: L,D-transpeptidase [Thermomicrobiales bacterium]
MAAVLVGRPWGSAVLRLLALLSVVLATGWLPTPAAAKAEWEPPTTVYIPQTGHNLSGEFLTYWRENSGATFLGNPITEEIKEAGVPVQYFERARLELRGDAVVLGTLGSEIAKTNPLRSPQQPRLVRGDGDDEPLRADPFAKLPFALFDVDPDDHRFFPESGHTLRYSFKLAWEKNGGEERYGLPISEEFSEISPIDGKAYTTQYFERARFEYHPGQVNNYSVVLTPLGTTAARARGLDTAQVAKAADVSNYDEALFSPPPVVPGVASRPGGANKWIDVNLSRQYLVAFEGTQIIWSGYVSSGKEGNETPTGTYTIFSKLTIQDMRGPDPTQPNGEYFQPDVPWVMYFAAGGYAIHGVYWHNSFGTPRSHGCVGLPVGSANFIYNWAPIGTPIVIHY